MLFVSKQTVDWLLWLRVLTPVKVKQWCLLNYETAEQTHSDYWFSAMVFRWGVYPTGINEVCSSESDRLDAKVVSREAAENWIAHIGISIRIIQFTFKKTNKKPICPIKVEIELNLPYLCYHELRLLLGQCWMRKFQIFLIVEPGNNRIIV